MTKDDDNNGCLLLIGLLVALIIGPLTNSFVLVKMWSWFIANTFHVQELTYGQAYGLAAIVGYMTYQSIDSSKKKTNYELLGELTASVFVRPAVVLLFAWLYKSYLFQM